MANTSDGTSDVIKWPGVSVSDGDKYCTVFLKIHNLKVKKKHGLFGSLEPTNGSVSVTFEKGSVTMSAAVKDDASKETAYEYKKTLPEEIDDKRSKWEIFKAERVKLELYKATPGSWERHARSLQSRN